LEIIQLKARVKRLEKANKVKFSKLRRLKKVGTSQRIESSDDIEDVFNQGRMINDLDKDEGIELVVDKAEIYNLDLDNPSKVLSMQEDDSEVQEVVEVLTTAKLITEVVTAATSQVSSASATISAAKPSIPAGALTVVVAYTRRRKGVIIRDPKEELSSKTPGETPILKDKGKGILIETPKPMKKKDQIELDAEYARKLHEEINKDNEEINKDIDWDDAIDHVKQRSMENQYIRRYYGMKKRPQTESEARKNMMAYLKNTDGFKMDFFKGMSYDEIRPIFQVHDEDDDVFTEATPLARKKYGFECCDPVDTPMVEKSKLDEDKEGKAVDLSHYRDADHAGCQDTRRSISGSLQFLGDRLISWSSKRSKHIDIRYHFIKEQVENAVIELYFVNMKYQLADLFTKALGGDRIEFLINKLRMKSFTPETLKQLTDKVDE
nr:ribonuclease H [Tanacetum cinerariifolium]